MLRKRVSQMNKKITNRKLIAAYGKLLKKGSDKITVSLLCEKADVARATFYNNYKDLDSFVEELHNYIIRLFFEQATYFMSCNDMEFNKAVKKENLLLNEYELIILNCMVGGSNYMDFAMRADSYYLDEQRGSIFPNEIREQYKDVIDIFTRGYFPILIFSLLDYNEVSLKRDIYNCRVLFKALREDIYSNLKI